MSRAPDPVPADRRPATQGCPRGAAAVPAGRLRLRPDWCGGDHSDEAVVEAIATVFRRFAELGTGRQVLLSLRGDGLLLPRRRPAPAGWWQPATYPAVHDCSPIRSMPGRSCSAAPAPRNARCDRQGGAAPCCCPASSGSADPRSPSRVHRLGHLRGEHRTAAAEPLAAPRVRRRRAAGRSALLQGRLRCGKCGR